MASNGNSRIWVLCADSARARFFSAATPTGPLEECEVLVNPEARQPEQDLITDQAGRTFSNRFGPGRGTMGGEGEAREHDIEIFAHRIAQRLNELRVHDEMRTLILVAAPAFLGLLRKNLDEHVLTMVTLTLDKDFSQLRGDELRSRLPQQLT